MPAAYALDPRALDHAAARIDGAAATLTRLDVAGPFGGAGEALPGSRSAGACLWAATRLDAAVDRWASHLVDLCETARLVARDAAETDHDVATRFRAGDR